MHMKRSKIRTRGRPDSVLMEGWVRVKQGRRVVVPWVKNHFVNYGLLSMVSWLTINAVASTSDVPAWGTEWKIKIGHNTTTATTPTLSDLVDEDVKGPNIVSLTNDNPATGQYRAKYVATWNAGTVSGTVGELGLRLKMWKSLQTAATKAGSTTLRTLASRISVGDGDFTAFGIDSTKPLSVEWHVKFMFV